MVSDNIDVSVYKKSFLGFFPRVEKKAARQVNTLLFIQATGFMILTWPVSFFFAQQSGATSLRLFESWFAVWGPVPSKLISSDGVSLPIRDPSLTVSTINPILGMSSLGGWRCRMDKGLISVSGRRWRQKDTAWNELRCDVAFRGSFLPLTKKKKKKGEPDEMPYSSRIIVYGTIV